MEKENQFTITAQDMRDFDDNKFSQLVTEHLDEVKRALSEYTGKKHPNNDSGFVRVGSYLSDGAKNFLEAQGFKVERTKGGGHADGGNLTTISW